MGVLSGGGIVGGGFVGGGFVGGGFVSGVFVCTPINFTKETSWSHQFCITASSTSAPCHQAAVEMSPWWSLCTLYLSHARWSYRRRLRSLLLCARSRYDVSCLSAITSHCLLILQKHSIRPCSVSDYYQVAFHYIPLDRIMAAYRLLYSDL